MVGMASIPGLGQDRSGNPEITWPNPGMLLLLCFAVAQAKGVDVDDQRDQQDDAAHP